ncbi:MAG: hydroxyisourate hydrolase [Sphingorhabdus sp.]
MKMNIFLAPLVLGIFSAPVAAAEISTHVLDVAKGVGGADVPVTLSQRDDAGKWVVVSEGRTDANGRVRTFGSNKNFEPGIYRLHFDMTTYPDASMKPFFPEITVTFSVSNAAGHYHVPVVVSPYGYSTYRGN